MHSKDNRINRILNNKRFKEYIKRNNESEINRKFCKHDIQHSLDVARIAYIINLEKGLGYEKDIIYSAGLLHDIGKWQQYDKGIPHNISSAVLAVDILQECGYDEKEIEMIKEAIMKHRKEVPDVDSLNYIIFYADKKSRMCFSCESLKECTWKEEKKNYILYY